MVKTLIQAKCDLNVKNNKGNSSLHQAAKNGRRDVVISLLENGADPHIQNNVGKKAIDLAKNNEVASLIGMKYLEGKYNDNIHYNYYVSLAISRGQYEVVLNFLEKVLTSEERGRGLLQLFSF